MALTIQKDSNVVPASGKGLLDVEDTIYVRIAKPRSVTRNRKKAMTPFFALCFQMPNAQKTIHTI